MAVEPPGWHGKLPSLGDFASRRLPHEFIESWDGWLAAGLAALREAQPEQWLDGYLASPIWRFLIMPGTLTGAEGNQGWSGVLMPSVDRAGRYFPFTAVRPLEQLPRSNAEFDALHRWLHELDDLAADALQDDWTVAQLEAQLERLRPPRIGPDGPDPVSIELAQGEDFRSISIGSAADVTARIAEQALGIWQTATLGQAFWWCEPGADPGRLVVTRGLPRGPDIGVLFGAVDVDPGDQATDPDTNTAGSR